MGFEANQHSTHFWTVQKRIRWNKYRNREQHYALNISRMLSFIIFLFSLFSTLIWLVTFWYFSFVQNVWIRLSLYDMIHLFLYDFLNKCHKTSYIFSLLCYFLFLWEWKSCIYPHVHMTTLLNTYAKAHNSFYSYPTVVVASNIYVGHTLYVTHKHTHK